MTNTYANPKMRLCLTCGLSSTFSCTAAVAEYEAIRGELRYCHETGEYHPTFYKECWNHPDCPRKRTRSEVQDILVRMDDLEQTRKLRLSAEREKP